MEPVPTPAQEPLRKLESVLETAARSASEALGIWLGRDVRVALSEVDEVDLTAASELLGPADCQVAVCGMELTGRLSGELLLVFDDATGLALADLILRRPAGTSTAWDELERSAACETANIVACALLNALAERLGDDEPNVPLLPSPPTFRHEFAGSLLEFVLMSQAMFSDRVSLARTHLTADGEALNLWLLYVPGAGRSTGMASERREEQA